MKNKICTKCHRKYSATSRYFYKQKGYQGRKDRLSSWCKICVAKRRKIYQQQHSKQIKKRMERYKNTPEGWLRCIFGDMKRRTTNPTGRNKCYVGVELKFTINEFIDYVLNDLQIDPRGLQVHRIFNNGHYEKGNIEFVTTKEHGLKRSLK